MNPINTRLFRDHDPAVAALAGMEIGPAIADGEPSAVAAGWFAEGVRRVSIPDTVDLDSESTSRAERDAPRRLALVRELTSYGIAVEWRLRLAGNDRDEWRQFSHLFPPIELRTAVCDDADGEQSLVDWRTGFRIGIYHYRRGPGFIVVRDQRSGTPRSTTIDDPAQLAAVAELERGGGISESNRDIATLFATRGFVTNVGEDAVWLPCRLRRWPTWLNRFTR